MPVKKMFQAYLGREGIWDKMKDSEGIRMLKK
jgi:hypothetical protein